MFSLSIESWLISKKDHLSVQSKYTVMVDK